MNARLRIIIINIYWYSMKILINIYTITSYYLSKMYRIINYLKYIYNSNPNNIKIVNNSIIHSSNLIKEPYDYLVYTKQNEDKTLMLLTTDKNIVKQLIDNTINLQLCTFKFISVLIKANDQIYDISNILKNNNNYYYIIGGRLFDKNFMKWICLYHLKIKLDDYFIVFMDNNINEITIQSSEYILLNENNYEIIK